MPSTIFANSSILNVCLDTKYAPLSMGRNLLISSLAQTVNACSTLSITSLAKRAKFFAECMQI